MIKAYPKIFTIGQDYVRDLFQDEVEITEKIDGSQFGFGKINGELFVRSKGCMMFFDNPTKMFKQGIEYVKSIEDRIPDNMIFYGEYLQTISHNALHYDRIPKNHIMLFGCCDNTEKFYSYDEIKKYADLFDLEVVPLVYRGKIDSPEKVLEFLGEVSILGGAKREGVVVKNYNRNLMIGGQVIPIMCGKYVSEEFKEVHECTWKKEHTGKGKWEVYKLGFRTPARWQKAVIHLKEKQELTNSPKDIGKLIAEVKKDITEEEKENIKKFLWNEFGDELLRTATVGLPEWYKEQLLKNSFQ
jgi:hypothetical protein